MDVHRWMSDDQGQTLYYAGALIITAAVGFLSGQYSQTKNEIENDIVPGPTDQEHPEQQSQVTVVPNPEEVWTAVQEDVASLGRTKKSKAQSPKGSGNRRLKIKTKLGLQALNVEARHQLLLATLEELRRQITSLKLVEKDTDIVTFHAVVLNVIVGSYKAAGKEWLGFEPTTPTTTEVEDDNGLEERQDGGEWHQVVEKIPIYAVVVKYLRFPPKPVETAAHLLDAAVDDSRPSESSSLEVSPTDNSALEMQQRGASVDFMGECIVASSTDIVEDLLLNVAELIALEFLTCLRNGVTSFPNSSNSLVRSGRLVSLRSSLRNSRALERFRNHVLFSMWLHRHFYSVISTFEDYHILLGIRNGSLVRRKCFVHRASELSKLKGWRLGLSYVLEAVDAIEPYLRIFAIRVGEVISFLLVTLIGRSLGLILKGIQSSVQIPWGKQQPPKKQ